MPRVRDNNVPFDSSYVGPMTRSRLKIMEEGEGREEVWSYNNNNQKRIDITPLDAFAIASSMLDCSFGNAETETQLSELEEIEDDPSPQIQPGSIASLTNGASRCHGNGVRDNNNVRDAEGGEMSASLVAAAMLELSFDDLGELETEVSRVDSDYHALVTPPPPPAPPPRVVKRKWKLGSYRGKAKAACTEPIAGYPNERAPHAHAASATTFEPSSSDRRDAGAGAFDYLRVDLE